ncbi:hypothetical protein PF438_04055 [Elizabethkingia meningoseptica]|uniref:hypothetical protein n=1 Tax=Elizabethkingia meningoseptica TaxID=238 RepID=UPI0022F17697|nr:hypothetical protein [Elizabethkingia meningoseptica]EJK5330553.1 hypothetical protein [Elizabethkingia meningoseptica]WBS75665.1 hypothetical protein PF438_04055 [Elizabethkingia meningoseptica]
MNSQNSKNNAIKAAYGEYWAGLSNEQQKYALENEGWIKVTPSQYHMDMFSRLKLNKNTHSVRPKSITGIRNNNSWTRIESEEDMPKEVGTYWVFNKITGKTERRFYVPTNKNDIIFFRSNYTHYQPIEVPKPPIF